MRRAAIALSVAAVLVPTGLAFGATGTSSTSSGGAVAALLSGLKPLGAAVGRDLGAVAPSTRVPLTLSLALRDKSALTARIDDRAAALTTKEFNARFAPTQASVNAVTSWARSAGLTVTSVTPDRTLVNVVGSATKVDAAFSVHLIREAVSDGGPKLLTSTVAAVLPAVLKDTLSSVVGLTAVSATPTAVPAVTPAVTPAAGLSLGSTSYDPQQFWSIYNAPSAASDSGAGQTLAVIAEGQLSGVQSDLKTFEAKYGLPTIPTTVVPAPKGSADTSNSDEYDLDSQYSTAFAPDASKLLLYDGASLSDADLLNAVDTWVSQDKATQASLSVGECEVLADISGFESSLDQVLEQAASQGQTLFVATGDAGGYCNSIIGENGVPLGIPDVDYPAASPYAIAVGGTQILGTALPTLPILGSLDEVAWDASGGGISLTEPAPAWQKSAGGSYLGLRRGVPDVSLDAAPSSGYDVIVGGSEEVIGGTSASAPSWQGIWARAKGAHGDKLGFAGPVLYSLPKAAFNDITIGTNLLYVATPGWDYVTGRGTPNIATLVSDS